MGLFGNGQQQGSSLRCFMPINQEDYQSAPPTITVEALAPHAKVTVNITDTITIADGPEANSLWAEGLWTVMKRPSGYQVTFQPPTSDSGYVKWTAILKAPDLNILNPSSKPTTDDGNGTLTWTFSPSKSEPPKVTVSLIGPWQVHMNLAADLAQQDQALLGVEVLRAQRQRAELEVMSVRPTDGRGRL